MNLKLKTGTSITIRLKETCRVLSACGVIWLYKFGQIKHNLDILWHANHSSHSQQWVLNLNFFNNHFKNAVLTKFYYREWLFMLQSPLQAMLLQTGMHHGFVHFTINELVNIMCMKSYRWKQVDLLCVWDWLLSQLCGLYKVQVVCDSCRPTGDLLYNNHHVV